MGWRKDIGMWTVLMVALVAVGCQRSKPSEASRVYAFSGDSAYQHVAQQVSYGARVPLSQAHYQCAKYIESTLRRYGLGVSVQQGEMTDYAGGSVAVYNIVGSYSKSDSTRGRGTILLCAHWDCRPWADEEEMPEDRLYAVDGANDGASGVGVLLELARQVSLLQPNQDIDFVFFDAEDMGSPRSYTGKEHADTWCLGSQLWAKQYVQDKALQGQKRYQYAVLLDMVGDRNAIFPQEYFSMQYAQSYCVKLWRTASKLGYGHLFKDGVGNPITDDHYYINTIAHIPCVDIIHYDIHTDTGFPWYWHTRHDTMENISAETLEAVGKTVINTILN